MVPIKTLVMLNLNERMRFNLTRPKTQGQVSLTVLQDQVSFRLKFFLNISTRNFASALSFHFASRCWSSVCIFLFVFSI